MKKKLFTLSSIAILSSSAFAFDSGTYVCKGFMSTEVFVLKDKRRAKHMTVLGTNIIKKERGEWRDDDDAAEVINEQTIIEEEGNKFKFQSPDAGGGVCQKTTEKVFFDELEKTKKEAIKRANSPEAKAARKAAKHKANIKNAKERANYYANTWKTQISMMPAQTQQMMLKETITQDYNRQNTEVKSLVKKELNTMGVKVPSINKTTEQVQLNKPATDEKTIKLAKKKAKEYSDIWAQLAGSPMASMMLSGSITPDYNKQNAAVKELIKKELNTMGVKIPSVNK